MGTDLNVVKRARAATPASRIWPLLPAIMAAAWLSVNIASLLLAKRPVYTAWGIVEVTTPLQRQLQFGSGAFLVLGVIFGTNRIALLARSSGLAVRPTLLLLLTIVAMAVIAIFRGSASELAYVTAFALSIVLGMLVWTSAPRAQTLFIWAFAGVCLSVVALAMLLYGLPKGRWIGGLHPNLVGFLLVVYGAFFLLRRSVLGWAVASTAFLCALSISSRYALLSLILICCSEMALRLHKKFGTVALVFGAASAAVLIFGLGSALGDVFLLSDPTRGLSSGGSGRADLNIISLQQFQEHFATGAGFRNRAGYFGAHNGYINLLNETGVFVFAMLMAVTAYAAFLAAREIIVAQSRHGPGVVTSYWFLASLLSALFQPQLINFGDSQGLAFLFGLSFVLVRATGVPQRVVGRANAKRWRAANA